MKRILVIWCIVAFGVSCQNDILPKPKAYLRLEYPAPNYKQVQPNLPFTFEKNTLADSLGRPKVARDQKSIGLDLEYPNMKGTIYLTYKKVNEDNLRDLLIDAQKITQEHTIKADAIVEQPYINEEKRVFGMFYEVGGNAASQSQFYVTDSVKHFVTGSLYFYAKPNYDSILPAAYYLRNDIKHLMETIKWVN